MIPVALSLLVAGSVTPDPDPATLVYYNARMALREGAPVEVLKLWLLRNSIESETGALSAYDEDFRSLAWVALGDLGFCQDGLEDDGETAGLWPLALHNWFLKNMRRGEAPAQPAPFDAFQLPQQQRFVSLDDVLSPEELRSVRFYRTDCYRMNDVLVASGLSGSADPADRNNEVRVLRFLLQAALHTVAPDLVKGRSTIEARLLDLRLKDMDLAERDARRAYRRKRRKIRELGGADEPPVDVAKTERITKLLSITTKWTADDWLALDPTRRRFLYEWADRAKVTDERLRIEVIDQLIARKDGAELASWLAYTGTTAAAREKIWSGARGKRLLGLDKKTGFEERAAIALHRGVDAVGRGGLPDALRSFAYALHYAPDSSASEDVRRLGLRWMSYVASRFEVNDELITTLVTLVPRGDLAQILETLIWQAAFSADAASFDRTVNAYRSRGALRRRVQRLDPLARGDLGSFLTALRDEMVESPNAVLRFLRRFLERLETQDGDVRLNHRQTLDALVELLAASTAAAELTGGLLRLADELEDQCIAMLEGMPPLDGSSRAKDRARALAPTAEVFAGRIRLAPSDPLPWPFPKPDIRAPSVFKPLPITPVEWRQGGQLVMGWKLGN